MVLTKNVLIYFKKARHQQNTRFNVTSLSEFPSLVEKCFQHLANTKPGGAVVASSEFPSLKPFT